MSKAAAPCSSCPSSKSEPSGKKKIVYTPNIDCVLEDVLPVSSDSLIKVKNFKKFLDYDLKTLNITGELQTYTHKNGFTHTKMVVTYQDKKTNKVNYLEIDVLDNINKKLGNTQNKTCSDPYDSDGPCTSPCYCSGTTCVNSSGGQCFITNSTVSTNTAANGFGATPKTIPVLSVGTQLKVRFLGRRVKVYVSNT